jgi:hypothetical protein
MAESALASQNGSVAPLKRRSRGCTVTPSVSDTGPIGQPRIHGTDFIAAIRRAFLLSLLVATNALAQGYTTPHGEWRGQTQYQAFIGTVSDPAAHAVVDLTVNIDPRGKVIGMSGDNGCRLLGVALPGPTPRILKLEVVLTGCSYAGLNRAYKGLLSVYAKEKYAAFSLQAVDVAAGKAGTYNIKSTMRR